MQIYIEYVIVNNFVVNAMILYLVGVILRRHIKIWRITLSSLIGTVYAVLLPYISFKYDLGITIILSIIMILVAFKHYSVTEYVMSMIVFYMITFLFGGTIIGISFMFKSNLINALIYPNSLVVSLIGLIVIVMTVIGKYFALYIERLLKHKRFYYQVTISKDDKKYEGIGFLDSGNRLYCDLVPVVILDKTVFDELIEDKDNKKAKILSISTINDKSFSYAYRLDSIEIISDNIHQIFTNVYGIQSDRKFKDFDVLLHSTM